MLIGIWRENIMARVMIIGGVNVGKEVVEITKALEKTGREVLVVADTRELRQEKIDQFSEPIRICNVERYEDYTPVVPRKSHIRPYKYHN